jgi:hypothetical protein
VGDLDGSVGLPVYTSAPRLPFVVTTPVVKLALWTGLSLTVVEVGNPRLAMMDGCI